MKALSITGLGSLMFYNARYYSPLLSRFVSADTIVPDGEKASVIPLTVDFHEPMFLAGVAEENAFTLQNGFWSQLNGKQKEKAKLPWGPENPQELNRYTYVLNNPLKYIDPSGHDTGDNYNGYGAACNNGGVIDLCSNGGTPIVRTDNEGNEERLMAIWITGNDLQLKVYTIWENDSDFKQFKEQVDQYVSAVDNAKGHFWGAQIALIGGVITIGITDIRAKLGAWGIVAIESVVANYIWLRELVDQELSHQKAVQIFYDITWKQSPAIPDGWYE